MVSYSVFPGPSVVCFPFVFCVSCPCSLSVVCPFIHSFIHSFHLSLFACFPSLTSVHHFSSLPVYLHLPVSSVTLPDCNVCQPFFPAISCLSVSCPDLLCVRLPLSIGLSLCQDLQQAISEELWVADRSTNNLFANIWPYQEQYKGWDRESLLVWKGEETTRPCPWKMGWRQQYVQFITCAGHAIIMSAWIW